MRDHSRTETAAQMGHYAKEAAVNCDHNHHANALVSVRETEYDAGSDNSDISATSQRSKQALQVADIRIVSQSSKLALQVAAKDKLFKKTGGSGEHDEKCCFNFAARDQVTEHSFGFFQLLVRVMKVERAQRHANRDENDIGSEYEKDSNGNIEQKGFN